MSTYRKPWLKLHAELGIEMPEMDDRPLGTIIEDWAAHKPDAPALQYFTRTFSFQDINQDANKLANALQELGISRGDVVGIHLPNIPQYVIALIAISKLGAIGSGVSPLLAPPEIAYQIRDAGIKVLLTLSDLAPAVAAMKVAPEGLAHIVTCGARDMLDAPKVSGANIDGAQSINYLNLIKNAAANFAQVSVSPQDIFMLQYTGGTTGKPKGAQISHRTLMSNPRMVAQGDPPLTDKEVFASAFPMFHIAGLSFAITTLICGGHCMLIPNPRDTESFIDLMLAYPPTCIAAVPALYDMLAANPRFSDVDYSRLRVAKTGAAPMTSTTRDTVEAIIGRQKISDVFGMTETGPCYVFHPLAALREGSIGMAIPGADVRILDVETGTKDMPPGEPGEICCAGPQLMTGYLNLPKESAHALRDIDGQRWMFSGDVGYMDEDGYIFLCDRAKDMLIVGGFKVFSVEVEDKLQAMECIAGSAIIGTADPNRLGNDIVNLFVQISPDYAARQAQDIKDEILAFVRENMAPYKVPKVIHFIDEIPLTPVGKIDKKKLRASLAGEGV